MRLGGAGSPPLVLAGVCSSLRFCDSHPEEAEDATKDIPFDLIGS